MALNLSRDDVQLLSAAARAHRNVIACLLVYLYWHSLCQGKLKLLLEIACEKTYIKKWAYEHQNIIFSALEVYDCDAVRFCMITASLLFQVTPCRIKMTLCSPVWFKPDGSEMYYSGKFEGTVLPKIICSSSCYSRHVWWHFFSGMQ